MKKAVSEVLFVVSLFVVVLAVAGSIYAVYDIITIKNDIAAAHNTSGIDSFGIGMGYGIVLFVISLLGLILSAVCIKLFSKKSIRYAAVAETVSAVILVIVSVFIFYA